tara:strand:- start:6323 stop:6664 length:342 start_codon:yes stop_codon:yes gene_type:complete
MGRLFNLLCASNLQSGQPENDGQHNNRHSRDGGNGIDATVIIPGLVRLGNFRLVRHFLTLYGFIKTAPGIVAISMAIVPAMTVTTAPLFPNGRYLERKSFSKMLTWALSSTSH